MLKQAADAIEASRAEAEAADGKEKRDEMKVDGASFHVAAENQVVVVDLSVGRQELLAVWGRKELERCCRDMERKELERN